MRRLAFIFALSGLALSIAPEPTAASGASGPSLSVIVGRQVEVDSISREELRLIFQTRKRTWPNGSRAIPFNFAPKTPLRQTFDSAVLGLDPLRAARYWIDRRVRGGDRPPRTVPSSSMMVRVVAALPGAVGYVEADAVTPSVKTIARLVDGQVLPP